MTPIELIRRGFYIFPLAPNSKEPPKGLSWTRASTLDPSVVADWIHRYPRCGWGIDCGRSGLLVVDDDRGKNAAAVAALAALEIAHGDMPATFTVKTKSGGYHYYYRGVGRTSASAALGKGLDSRGVGGYVVAPGVPGYVVDVDAEIAEAPAWLLKLLGAPSKRAADHAQPPAGVVLDTPEAIARALAYLEIAPDAPGPRHGGGGGYHTIKIACQIRDFGISEAVCTELIHSSAWARRIDPPWDDWDELAAKVGNAYRYASGQIGAAAEAAFDVVDVPAPKTPPATPADDPLEAWRDTRDHETKSVYLVLERIETPSTGMIFGDPCAGKSFLALDLACGVAAGTAWQGHMALPGTAIYFAGEGRKGLHRRAKAWETHHGVRADRLWISKHRVEFSPSGLAATVAQMDAIRAREGPIALCVVDTLARHIRAGADENSAKDVGELLNLCNGIQDRYNCVVAIVHHSGKTGKDQGRGSSALRGAMDWEMMVTAPSLEKGAVRRLSFTKQKEGDIPPAAGFTLEEIDFGGDRPSAVPVPCAITDISEGLPATTASALTALRWALSEGGGKSVTRETWRTAFKASIPVPISRKALSARFSRAEAALSTSGLIAIDGEEIALTTEKSPS